MKRKEFQCPVCSSANTRRQSEVHAEGTSTSSGPKFDVTHTTALADQNQPPPRQRDPKIIKIQVGIAVTLSVLCIGYLWIKTGNWPYSALGGVILFAGGISEILVRLAYRNNLLSHAYYLQFAQWLTRWRCLDRGCVFLPDDEAKQQ
ncbi:MAG: hypothetical protein Q8S20_08940 [Sulfuritalea sp.]|nr:hypothetical protein [Sulfuritalea sp.]